MKKLLRYSIAVIAGIISLSSYRYLNRLEKNTDQSTQKNANAPTLSVTAEKLYDSLRNPWGMAWLPDGRLLVTERSGEILVFKDNKFTGQKLAGVPKVFYQGQGGLMDIKLHPDYAKNKWIYITYSKPGAGGAATALMRFKLQGNNVVEAKDIFVAKPFIPADYHFGSRVVFDKNNFVFVSVGERGTRLKVHELNNDHGKVHRLYDDGRVPNDNPFVGQKGANPTIWTVGHRNPQGLIYDAANDRVWELEHGPKGGDELNLIEKGKNYGWPKTTYGIDYNGSIISEYKELPGIENPVRYWVPSIAPCGMMLVTSNQYPEWKGNILVGALAFRQIARVQLDGTKYVTEEKLLQDLGRFRAIAEGPDGFIYAVTEGPGLLVKLVPQK